MPKPYDQRPARRFDGRPGGHTPYQQDDFPSRAMGALETARLWVARSRQRRCLGELAELSDHHLLHDIGVARDAARREAAKPFWQR